MSLVNTAVEAITVLIQAAELGQKSGIFELDEARVIADAIDFLVGKPTEIEEPKVEMINENQPNLPNVYNPDLNTAETPYIEPSGFKDPTIPVGRTAADIAVTKK